jgi:arylsulfatase A-like enzyme
MLHHPAPHMPFQEKEELVQKYAKQIYPEPISFHDSLKNLEGSPRPFNITMEGLMGFQGRPHVWGEYAWEAPAELNGEDRKQWIYQRLMRAYLACIESLDDNVGKVMDYLKDSGLDENTIVIYTSDQGFFLGEHGWYDKRFFYEESIHMPLIISHPGAKSKVRINNMMLNIDIPLGILELAQIEAPEDMQGKSFLPLLFDAKNQEWRDDMYYHYYESREDSPLPVMRHCGIRTERYKLICFYTDKSEHWELYDLKLDPKEMDNLIRQEKFQDLIVKLKARMAELQEEYGDTTYNFFVLP